MGAIGTTAIVAGTTAVGLAAGTFASRWFDNAANHGTATSAGKVTVPEAGNLALQTLVAAGVGAAIGFGVAGALNLRGIRNLQICESAMRFVGVNVAKASPMENAIRTDILAATGGAAGLTGAFVGVGTLRDDLNY